MPRLRSERLYIMVTEEEKKKIKRKMEMAGLTNMGEFVRRCLTYNKIVNIDVTPLSELAYEVNKIGVNINQIAKKVNANNSVEQEDIEEIKGKIDAINQLLYKFFKMIRVSEEM